VDINQILDPQKVDKLFRAKAEYGQLFLFNSKEFVSVFRPLTVEETETLAALGERLNQCAVEDWLFRTCFVTGNKDVSYFLEAGPYLYVSNIASQLPVVSSAQDKETYNKAVLQSRENLNTLQNVVETIITKGYIGLEHVKKYSQRKQFDLLARAETISGEMLDLGEKGKNKQVLRKFTEGATVIGGTESITSPGVADKPDFNEEF
jgi:hypothetical protein